jgi:PIN domain nuclease of toxin-antitoxin system
MQALLDTSSFLWFITDNENLSCTARNFIADVKNNLLLSAASLWEIAIKVGIGKLELLQPFDEFIPEQLNQNSIDVLPIKASHLSKLIVLPFHHRDPFDRIIIAQAIAEGIPLIASDAAFHQYGVELIW